MSDFNPVNFDWSQGVQNIGGTIYQPIFDSTGSGEEFQQGQLQNVLRYKEGQTSPGQTYEMLDPTTGKVIGLGKFQKTGGIGSLLKTAATDLGPLLLAAMGINPQIAAALGTAAAGTVGITGLSPAVAGAIGTGITNAGLTAAQGGNLSDVLKAGVKAGAPGYLAPTVSKYVGNAMPDVITGNPIVDDALSKAARDVAGGATKAVITGQDLDLISILRPAVAGAIADTTGIDNKTINTALNLALNKGTITPEGLFKLATSFAPSLTQGEKQDPSAGYGGSETEGFFDPDAETSPLPDWALDPYKQETRPGEYYAGLNKIIDEWDEADIIPDTYGNTTTSNTSMSPMEMSQFLEANIDDPGTIETLMQDYFPDLYKQTITTTGTLPKTGVVIPDWDVMEEPDRIPGSPTDTTPQPPKPDDDRTVVSGPAPTPAPTPAPATKAPTPAPAQPGLNLGALLEQLAKMQGKEDQDKRRDQTAKMNVESPFGSIYDTYRG